MATAATRREKNQDLTKPGRAKQLTAILILGSFFIQLTEGLKLSAVHIPALVQRGTNFWLSCQFELDEEQIKSGDQLYSVKWYKNNEEFYRLLLANTPDLTQQDLGGQQLSFAQSGVNVMMSWSNATHVRLLNASLDSEGVYACEISTQNLSTIRYEREVRLYVLPHSKLNIIGFKNRYALGDKVDLICSSDFSRPQPALAWFINGKRILADFNAEEDSSRWFELELESKSKLNEPTLFRLNLGLKFKLSRQLLAAFGLAEPQSWTNLDFRGGGERFNALGDANQRRNQSRKGPTAHHFNIGARKDQLSSAAAAAAPAMQAASYQLPLDGALLKLECKYKLTEISDVTFNELLLSPATVREPRRPDANFRERGAPEAPVTKSINHQVVQANYFSSTTSLVRGLEGAADNCELGSLALQADDPLILFSDSEPGGAGKRRRGQESAHEDELISADCSTIGALAGAWPESAHNKGFCADQATRRKALISGKYLQPANEEPPNQRLLAANRQRYNGVAYLSLDRASLARNWTTNGAQEQQQLRQHQDNPSRADSSASEAATLFAPPLLEWFINNQEAPNSSYTPDLPLSFRGRSPGGAPDRSEPLLPSIDYAEYFANFDSRTIRQRLGLNFKADKRYFMTPDSKLKLRCSSTQAQVLWFESSSLIIVPTASDQLANLSWQQRPHQQGATARPHSYHNRNTPQRTAPNSVAAASNSNNNAMSASISPITSILLLSCSYIMFSSVLVSV